MRVRLTRKLAERVDGIDLSSYQEGDVLDLSGREAELLVAEGWAVRAGRRSRREIRHRTTTSMQTVAADTQRAANRRRLQRLQRAVDHQRFEPHADRRLEDQIRDELHDEHARIVNASPRRKDRSASNRKDDRS